MFKAPGLLFRVSRKITLHIICLFLLLFVLIPNALLQNLDGLGVRPRPKKKVKVIFVSLQLRHWRDDFDLILTVRDVLMHSIIISQKPMETTWTAII